MAPVTSEAAIPVPRTEATPELTTPFKSQLVESMAAILFGKEAASEKARELHKLRMEKGGEIAFKADSLQPLGGNPDFGYMIEMAQRAREAGVIDSAHEALIRDNILLLLRMTRGGATLNPDKDAALIKFLGWSGTAEKGEVKAIDATDDAELMHFAKIFGRSEQLVYLLANQLGQSGNEVELARNLQVGDLKGEQVKETLVKIIQNPQLQGVLSRVLDEINREAPEYLVPLLGTELARGMGSDFIKYLKESEGAKTVSSSNLEILKQKPFQQYFQKIDEALGEAVADFYNETLLKGGKRTLELASSQDKGKKEANVNRKDKANNLFKRFFKYALFTYKENGESKSFNDKFMLEMVRVLKSSTPAEAMRVILRNIESTSIGRTMPKGYGDEIDKALKDFGVDATNSFDLLVDEMRDADLDAIAAEAVPQVLGWAFMRPDYWKRMDFTEAQAVGLARIYGGEQGVQFIEKVMEKRKLSKKEAQKVIEMLGPDKTIDADTLMSGPEKIKKKIAKILFGKDVKGGIKRLFFVFATLGLSDLFGVTGTLAHLIGGARHAAAAGLGINTVLTGGALAGANKAPGG